MESSRRMTAERGGCEAMPAAVGPAGGGPSQGLGGKGMTGRATDGPAEEKKGGRCHE